MITSLFSFSNFWKLISFKILISISFLILLSLINFNDFALTMSKFSEINNSAEICELDSLPPELIIGPIKKPKSSIVKLFFFLLNSYKVLNTILLFIL